MVTKLQLSSMYGKIGNPMAQKNGSPEQKKVVQSLFKSYDAANEALAKAKSDVEAAMKQRSAIVKQIAETAGMSITRKGVNLKVMSRTPKNERGEPTGETTWFFRGEAPVDAFNAD